MQMSIYKRMGLTTVWTDDKDLAKINTIRERGDKTMQKAGTCTVQRSSFSDDAR